jgi:steroid delta-isomerase-like uncharacterized protein
MQGRKLMGQFTRLAIAAALLVSPLATVAFAGEAENEATARRFYTETVAGHFDTYSQFIAADVVDHDPAPDQKPGLQGIIDLNKGFIAAFPDLKVDIQLVVAKGDYVTVYSEVKGTHKGDFLGVKATDKPIDFTSIDIWHFRDGKLQEVWHVEDIFSVMVEIGAVKM